MTSGQLVGCLRQGCIRWWRESRNRQNRGGAALRGEGKRLLPAQLTCLSVKLHIRSRTCSSAIPDIPDISDIPDIANIKQYIFMLVCVSKDLNTPRLICFFLRFSIHFFYGYIPVDLHKNILSYTSRVPTFKKKDNEEKSSFYLNFRKNCTVYIF